MLESIWQISLSIAVVTLLLILLAPILNKRCSARWRYVLWMILAVRLLIPLHFSPLNPPVKISVPAGSIQNLMEEAHTNSLPSNLESQTVEPSSPGSIPQKEVRNPTHTVSFSLRSDLIFIGWSIGVFLFLSYYFITYTLFIIKIKNWCEPLNRYGEKPDVYFCSLIASPMLIGFFRPRILIPKRVYSDLELEMIQKHETLHYKRHDVWYKLILVLANALHWFNPFVWYLVHCANRDLEYSCDDLVTQNMDLECKKMYSMVLLHCAAHTGSKKVALSTYMTGGEKSMKNRIQNILSNKKKKGILLCTAVLVFALLVSAFVAFPQIGQVFAKEYVPPYPEINTFQNEVAETLLKRYEGASILSKDTQEKLIDDFDSFVTYATVEIQTDQKPYEIKVKGKNMYDSFAEEFTKLNACGLFMLIPDVDVITFELTGQVFCYNRNDFPIAFEEYTDPNGYSTLMLNLRFAELQQAVDRGEELWRLDPKQVIYHENTTSDSLYEKLTLVEQRENVCIYSFPHSYYSELTGEKRNITLYVLLVQPFAKGDQSIWVPISYTNYKMDCFF